MATYNPPTQNLVIFDNSVFTDSNPTGNLTRAQADLLYLHFPFGQGAETIPSVSITGTSLLNGTVSANNNLLLGGVNGVNYLQFPNGTKQYVAAIDYLTADNLWSGKNQFNGDVSLNAAVTLNGASLSISSVPSTSDANNILVYDISSNSIKYEPSGNIINATKSNLLASNNLWTGDNSFNNIQIASTKNINFAGLIDIKEGNTSRIYTDVATNNLILAPSGTSVNLGGKTLAMAGGEIHNCSLVHSINNSTITLQGLGASSLVNITGSHVSISGDDLIISSVPSTSDANNILVYDIASNQVRYEPSGNLITASNNKLLASNNVWSGKNQFNSDVSLNQAITLNGASLNITGLTSASKANQIYYDTTTNKISYSPIPSSATNTFYVAGNGNDTTGVGSINAPYLTIQKAIDQCTSITAYYSIYIAAGSYTESLTITGTTLTGSPRISLIGATNTSNSKGVTINGSLSVTLTTATGNEANNVIACNNLVITNSAANAVNVSGQGFSLFFTNCNLITASTSSTLTLSSSATTTRYYFDRTNVSNAALTSTNPLVYVSRGAIWAITGCDFTNLNTGGTVITVTTNNALLLAVSNSVLTNNQAGVLVDCSSTLSAGNCGFSNSTYTAYASATSAMFLLGNAGGLGTGGGYSFLNNTIVNANATYATNAYISLRGGVQLQCDNNIFYNTKLTAMAFTPFNSLSGTNNVFRYNNNVYINLNAAGTNTVTYPTVNGTSVIISDNILSDVNYTSKIISDISLNGAVTLGTDIWATSLASTSDANAVSYNTSTKKLGYVALPAAPSTLLASNNTWAGKNQFNADVSLNSITSLTSDIYATTLASTSDANVVSYNTSTKKLGYVALPAAPSTLLASNNAWAGKNQFNADVSLNSITTVTGATTFKSTIDISNNPVYFAGGAYMQWSTIIPATAPNRLQFFTSTATGNGTIMTLSTDAARVGINSFNPTVTLDVGGDIKSASLGTGAVYSNSGVLSNSGPSDPSLKKNIISLNDSSKSICDIVLKLNPISFEWIDPSMGTGTKYGFSALQIKDLIPDIASTFKDAKGDIKHGYDPVSLIPFLITALQQQQKKITDLEDSVSMLLSKM